ncbi:Levansucrase [Lactiplantibacillus plantarum]|uniref:KxYKxGKxW signal peptide domain-containing protein n=1 Tax=Lactiplantibacillus plantarum TaxID=1590 RepID=UPI001069F390|nr:Levansucrase [Lactiplantibacillus plantarum]VFI64331.1 Levansucrase [Lactiplantibacillus plantarum]
MLRNNYFGEIKTHYKLYKCGKNWAVMGISLFSLGLGMLVTGQPVSANSSQTTTQTKPVQAGQAAATNFVDQRLPQTGETDQQHMTLSGLLLLAMSSLLGLFGMTKRQRKE